MNRNEILGIFHKIEIAYPRQDITFGGDESKMGEMVNFWLENLKKYDAKVINNAINKHIAQSDFPPSLAKIISLANQEIALNLIEENRLAKEQELDKWRKEACPPPAGIMEKFTKLAEAKNVSDK